VDSQQEPEVCGTFEKRDVGRRVSEFNETEMFPRRRSFNPTTLSPTHEQATCNMRWQPLNVPEFRYGMTTGRDLDLGTFDGDTLVTLAGKLDSRQRVRGHQVVYANSANPR